MHIVDMLSYNKMNVLHWKLGDARNFPLELLSIHDLTKLSSYSPLQVYHRYYFRELLVVIMP